MKNYTVCMVGVGSIAQRHIKNLKRDEEHISGNISIDALRSGKGKELSDTVRGLIRNVYYKAEELPGVYDAVFITNPTAYHAEMLKKLRDKGRAFFIEKPIFHTSNIDFSELFSEKNIYYVACPLRYTKVVQYLKKNVDFSKVISLRAVSSSYLPDWRPGIDYRDTYSACKALGGGVSIDLIHEWDYITYLIGCFPIKVYSFIKKLSNLELDSDDIAVYIGEYEDKLVELHLDYFTKKSKRFIEIQTDSEKVIADLIEGTVKKENEETEIFLKEERDEYQLLEIKNFFDIIEGRALNENDFEHAIQTLKLAEGKQMV